MTTFKVHLTDGRTAAIAATGVHLDYGALVFDGRDGPVVFPAGSWSLAHPEGTQIVWTPAPAEIPPESSTSTGRGFA